MFEKFEQRTAAAVPGVAPPGAETPLQIARDPLRNVTRLGRMAVLIGMAIWTWQVARVPMGVAVPQSILHMPNLVIY